MRHPTKNQNHTLYFPDGSSLSFFYDIHETPIFDVLPIKPVIEEGFKIANERFLETLKPQHVLVDCRNTPCPELPACFFIYVGKQDDYENGTVLSIASKPESIASDALTFSAANHFRKMTEEAELALTLKFRDATPKQRRKMILEADEVIQKHREKR